MTIYMPKGYSATDQIGNILGAMIARDVERGKNEQMYRDLSGLFPETQATVQSPIAQKIAQLPTGWEVKEQASQGLLDKVTEGTIFAKPAQPAPTEFTYEPKGLLAGLSKANNDRIQQTLDLIERFRKGQGPGSLTGLGAAVFAPQSNTNAPGSQPSLTEQPSDNLFTFKNPYAALEAVAPQQAQLTSEQQINNIMREHYDHLANYAKKGYNPEIVGAAMNDYTKKRLQAIQTTDSDKSLNTLTNAFNNAKDLKQAMIYAGYLDNKYGIKMNADLIKAAWENPDYKAVTLDLGGSKKVYAYNPKNPKDVIDMVTGEVTADPNILMQIEANRLLEDKREEGRNFRATLPSRTGKGNEGSLAVNAAISLISKHEKWIEDNTLGTRKPDETKSPWYKYLPSAQATLGRKMSGSSGSATQEPTTGNNYQSDAYVKEFYSKIDQAIQKNVSRQDIETYVRQKLGPELQANGLDPEQLLSTVQWWGGN